MPPPRSFTAEGALYCEAGGLHDTIDASAGQRWFIPVAAWDSPFRRRIVEALEEVGATFARMLSAGIPLDEARQVLPAGAMMNLEFESTFGEGEQL